MCEILHSSAKVYHKGFFKPRNCASLHKNDDFCHVGENVIEFMKIHASTLKSDSHLEGDCHWTELISQVIAQLAALGGMPQLPQRFRLYLTDTLTCHIEIAADLFKRMFTSIFETEAQFEHIPFAFGQ